MAPFVAWFYILYFGLGMPFICWGAVGEPGHPHRLPHLVFMEPVTAVEPIWAHEVHAHQQHVRADDVATVQPDPPSPPVHPADVAGRTTPAISAITLLTLIFISAGLIQRLPQVHSPIEMGALYVRPFVPVTLTPPPRHTLLVSVIRR